VTVAEFESIQRNSRPEQMCSKMKFVFLTGAVGKADRFKVEVFKPVQPIQLGHFRVKAPAAKRPVPFLKGTDVDDVVASYKLAAPGATGLLVLPDLDFCHRH